MKISQAKGGIRTLCCTPALLAIALAFSPTVSAQDPAGKVSPADERCLACHSMPALSKSMGDGEKLSLHVDKNTFAGSVHVILGCRGCHRGVDVATHPVMSSIASAREYSIEAAQSCKTCHAARFGQYESSIHASLVAEGDLTAPLCSSCHDPHGVQKKAHYDAATGQPCKACHEEIFDAYAGSVHGQAKAGEGKAQAPFCVDCHDAHEISAVAAGDGLKKACLSCHEGALAAHDEWLPNSARHLESVSCPACHSPMAERSVDLRLYDTDSSEMLQSDPQFDEQARAADVAGDGLDPLELWTLMRNTGGENAGRIGVRGRLEVSSGPQAHQLAFKTEAVRDCTTCHQSGAEAYQNVTVSVADPDGRRVKYEAGEDTLTSAVSVDAVGGFYTAGGTRIKILDVLLILGILTGLGIPTVHWTLRKLAKKKG